MLLAALDRGQLPAVLRDRPSGGAAFHVVYALLTGHSDLLGDPVETWRELAVGSGGTASAFLGDLALNRPAARWSARVHRLLATGCIT
ncbi:hypothetical protein ACIQVO_38305 [Streptomyces sp. NPDC101062]|uniref:hypothetical protein n=1 Tax=unclassified Streptomyces TaxID=2593676 RepID=UPI00381609FC